MDRADTITLQEAADRLGVHYMTAYRYVRTGKLPAAQEGREWRVEVRAVDELVGAHPTDPPRPRRSGSRADVTRRLADRLCANDEPGAWRIVEDVLVGGAEPPEVLVELVAPAMARVGDRWEAGKLTIADEHRATAVAHRVVGRLGPRFARRGRRRGTVVLGAPEGDHHALPVAIAADVVRGRGFNVVELGSHTPAASFADAAGGRDDLVAVVVTMTAGSRPDAPVAIARVLRDAGVDAPVLVGGSGAPESVGRASTARLVPGDARALASLVDELAG
jgi:excisionase family DNA binding protein